MTLPIVELCYEPLTHFNVSTLCHNFVQEQLNNGARRVFSLVAVAHAVDK